MSWAELFERAADFGVTEREACEVLAERRRDRADPGDAADPDRFEEDRP